MKIAFDAKRVTHNSTGLGNYSRYIINNLSGLYLENQYLLFTTDEGKKILRDRIEPNTNISYRYPQGIYSKLPSFLWRSFGIISDLQKEQVDIFHGLSNELPLHINKGKINAVVTIHDLIFERYPQFYKPADRFFYTCKYKQACMLADQIIAVSEQTKRDIVSFWKIPEEKISVIYQGCDPSFYRTASADEIQNIKDKYHIKKPFILYLGSIEERKNLLLLVRALKKVKEDITLIAIGKQTRYTEIVQNYIRENDLSARVQILHHVPFAELPVFYQMASMFVYPSFFEGFGIPVLEALVSNTPVIAATGSCLEEAGGLNSLYCDPTNENELSEQIKAILNDTGLADSMRERGKEYAQRFDKGLLTSQLIKLYGSMLK